MQFFTYTKILRISVLCLSFPFAIQADPTSTDSSSTSTNPTDESPTQWRSSADLREYSFLEEPSAKYREDQITVQFVSGALFSPTGIGPDTPTLNYNQNNLRLGWMLNEPMGEHLFRGNVELLLELSTSFIFSGFGDVIIGPTALARYNFVQPGSRFVPYLQVGAGVVYTDAYEDRSQDAIGQAIEFTPQASIGFRYLIDTNWSIDGEAMYHHISNASMSDRNDGINALGGFVGVSYFFDNIWE